MREILFRGKLHSGEWAYGNLVVSKNGIAIITPDDTPLGKYGQIASETVGQYTGLKDENGQRIFEGDILKDDWGKNYKVLYSTTSCSFMQSWTGSTGLHFAYLLSTTGQTGRDGRP